MSETINLKIINLTLKVIDNLTRPVTRLTKLECNPIRDCLGLEIAIGESQPTLRPRAASRRRLRGHHDPRPRRLVQRRRPFRSLLYSSSRFQRLGGPLLVRQARARVLLIGFSVKLIISSSLVDAYVKCRFVDDARKLFDDMPIGDVLS